MKCASPIGGIQQAGAPETAAKSVAPYFTFGWWLQAPVYKSLLHYDLALGPRLTNKWIDSFGGIESIAPDVYSSRQRTPEHRIKYRLYLIRCPSGGIAKGRTFQFDLKIINKTKTIMFHTKGIIHWSCANALYLTQAIQRDKCNLTRFIRFQDLKIFPECFRGPMKTLWRATCGPRACTWMDHTGITLSLFSVYA